MNFDNLIEEECLNPTADDPLDCPTKPVPPPDPEPEGDYELLLKPEYSLRETGEPTQFRTFIKNKITGEEAEVIEGLIYKSSNIAVAFIGPTSGRAFGSSPGIVDISVEWQDMIAFAQLEIIGDCDSVNVGMILVIDNSKSMSQPFSTAPIPAGQPAYATRLSLAKATAKRFILEVDESKDYIGVSKFSNGSQILQALTQNIGLADNAIGSISATQNTTNLEDALSDAIQELDQAQEDLIIQKRVIVLITDGENKAGAHPISLTDAFKDSGGVIVTFGTRCSGNGFALLKKITTEGMFINTLPSNASEAGNWLSGLKSYFCAGHCEPPGDETINKGALNYTGFINWDVVTSEVDLIGGEYPYELFNLLPGNGLYVDMAGSGPGYHGKIISKTAFDLVAGRSYKLSFKLAGNQRWDQYLEGLLVPFVTRARVENPENSIDISIEVSDYSQDFTLYEYEFVAPSTASAKISFENPEIVVEGKVLDLLFESNLLDEITFEDLTTPEVLLYDNFDDENPTYIEATCVIDNVTLLSEGYGYCPSVGCLDEPIEEQVPDPTPLPDTE